jgi:hypothetical protein
MTVNQAVVHSLKLTVAITTLVLRLESILADFVCDMEGLRVARTFFRVKIDEMQATFVANRGNRALGIGWEAGRKI